MLYSFSSSGVISWRSTALDADRPRRVITCCSISPMADSISCVVWVGCRVGVGINGGGRMGVELGEMDGVTPDANPQKSAPTTAKAKRQMHEAIARVTAMVMTVDLDDMADIIVAFEILITKNRS